LRSVAKTGGKKRGERRKSWGNPPTIGSQKKKAGVKMNTTGPFTPQKKKGESNEVGP